MNFSENASKQQKSIVQLYVAHIGEKNIFYYYFSAFTGLIGKNCLNKSKFTSGFPFSNILRKTNFLSISVLLSEIFWTK